jgi:DNA polymerase-3 subunit epsilon
MSWAAIDFETANQTRGSACALGIAIVEDSQVVQRSSWLIRPPTPDFNPYNVMIHGITADDVASAPTFDVLWPSIQGLLEGRPVVAHNASFDTSVLRHSLDAYGLPWPNLKYVCTRVLAKKVWTDLLSYSLPVVADRCGIKFLHHDPEEDAVASAEVALRCCEALSTPEPAAVAEAARLRIGALSPLAATNRARSLSCGLARWRRRPTASTRTIPSSVQPWSSLAPLRAWFDVMPCSSCLTWEATARPR